MAKFRYLIERGPSQQTVALDGEEWVLREADIYLAVITPEDETGKGSTDPHLSVEDAQAEAERLHRSDGSEDPADHPLVWKDPPEAWKPDALFVSQYLDDGVEPNRDR